MTDSFDSKKVMKKFHGFFKTYHEKDIRRALSSEKDYIEVDFFQISEYDLELGDTFLQYPEDTTKIMDGALKEFLDDDTKILKARLTTLPVTEQVMIRNIRSEHLGKLIMLEGLVIRKTDVRPRLTHLEYLCTNSDCPLSQDKLRVIQKEEKTKTLKACPRCRAPIEIVNKVLIDTQSLVLGEIPEQLDNSADQPKRINVVLQGDLVSPFKDSKTNPGARIYVIGIVKELPLTTRTGADSVNYEIIVDGHYVGLSSKDYSEIHISKEEEKKIKNLAVRDDVYEVLTKNFAPSIYGNTKIKEAILLQLFSGAGKEKGDGIKIRGDIHVLLIGDPGSAKSQMLKAATRIAPKASFVSGKSATGAGLVAAVVRDELTKGWALEAGAMVLASGGLCCTTADAQFITEDYRKISFEELFKDVKGEGILYPDFKVLGMNTENGMIEPFNIKHAFKKKNDKRILKIKTRTGRELKLTEDNEVYTIQNSVEKWKEIKDMNINDYIAVPKEYAFDTEIKFDSNFAYLAGLIATDGHISLNNRRGMVSIYNTNKNLIQIAQEKLDELKLVSNIYVTKAGRVCGTINGKKVISRKTSYKLYHSRKKFAQELIEFGVPCGNKSTQNPLSNKILQYDNDTIKEFLKGTFDGDGSIRENPYEVTITTGILENAKLYQELFLRLGIISSVKKSNRCWHCDIRGRTQCQKFFDVVGSNHDEKYKKLSKLITLEVKDRIEILPNCQKLFKNIRQSKKGQLGASTFKYMWNYSRDGVTPSIHKLKELNEKIQSDDISAMIENDILWDKIESIEEVFEEYVYDFTMIGTQNFIANNIIMHNCIDEMDKMAEDDTSAMHEALEQQTVSIAKANIRATLRCQTTVLGAANPKMGRFDPYGDIGRQIDFPPALLSRFDLIFIIRDIPDKKRDDLIADHILQTNKDLTKTIAELDPDFIKKYIAYAREKINPVITDEAIKLIKEFYVKIRSAGADEETGVKSVPITARQLEAIVRLAEAYAKINLCKKVTKEYAQKAIDMQMYCLEKIGIDPKTGELDIDRITTGITATTRNQYKTVNEIIDRLETEKPEISYDDISDEADKAGINRKDIQRILDKLKQEGIIFEPRKNIFKKLL